MRSADFGMRNSELIPEALDSLDSLYNWVQIIYEIDGKAKQVSIRV